MSTRHRTGGGTSRREFVNLVGTSLLASPLALACTTSPHQRESASMDSNNRPNVVLIATDNQGAWTLGCYGNPDIRTPHLDRMAAEGVRFARGFSNNAVCSPTRATLLTGLMPSQHGVHRYIANEVMMGPDAYGTIDEFRSLPLILSENGYTCGMVGKWHLGDSLRPQCGFHRWIIKDGGHTTDFFNHTVVEHGETRTVEEHATDFWTRHAVDFIEQNHQQPFFLYLAYNGPYGLGSKLLETTHNRHVDYYADKDMDSFPKGEIHPWQRQLKDQPNNLTSMRNYASEVSHIDDGVGEILATLERLGLDDNTLVIFIADQGLAGGHKGLWGMADHSRPLNAFDWTMWIPFIMRHPGRLPAGTTVDHLVANYDLYPTVLRHVGLAGEIPAEPPRPGRDLTLLWQDEDAPVWRSEDAVFYEFENTRVIRTPEWKYIERIGGDPNELYHLADDPAEDHNLYGQEGVQEVQAALRRRLVDFFLAHSVPDWDLWRGGDAKGGLVLGKEPYTQPWDLSGVK